MDRFLSRLLRRRLLFLAFLLSVFVGQPCFAKGPQLDPREIGLCYNAISRASQQMHVPADVMLAISLTETGKKIAGKISPWPWTVNMEGAGKWFATRREALAYVKKHFARGARSFDVGCFQINYKWHHQHFRSIEDMFDPQINATYAAKYLGELYRETGSWTRAAGFYHSRTPKFAKRYSARFERYRARLAGRDVGPAFEGHGSEALQLAQTSQPTQPIGGRLPLVNLSNAGVRGETTRGSLVVLTTGSGGLLQRSTRPLF